MGAFATGTAKWNGAMFGVAHAGDGTGDIDDGDSGGGGGGGNNDKDKHKDSSKDKKKSKDNSKESNKAAKEFLQTLDAIEIQLKRFDELLSRLETNVAKTYESWGRRNKNLKKEIINLRQEIKRVDKTLEADTYRKKAKQAAKEAGIKKGEEGYKEEYAPGKELSQEWIKKIENAANSGEWMTIDDVKDEALWKKIQAYQTWYEKHVNLQKKKEEYINKLAQATIQKLQLIQTKYEAQIGLINGTIENAQKNVSLNRYKNVDATYKRGKNRGKKIYTQDDAYYREQYKGYKADIAKYKAEKRELEAGLNAAVKNGTIKKGSEEWLKWKKQIQTLEGQIIEAQTNIGQAAEQELEGIQSRWGIVLDGLSTSLEGFELEIERNQYNKSIYQTTTKRTRNGRVKKTTKVVSNKNDPNRKLYEKEISNNQASIQALKNQRAALNRKLAQQVKKGRIQKGSDAWKEWQNKIKEISNEIVEKQNEISEAAIAQIENIQNKWESALSVLEANMKIYDAKLSQKQYLRKDNTIEVNNKKISTNKSELAYMKQEAKEMQQQLNSAVKKGRIKKNSQAYIEQSNKIKELQAEIIEKETEISDISVDNLEWIQSKYQSTIDSLSTQIAGYEKKIQRNQYRTAINGRNGVRANRDDPVNDSYKAIIAKNENIARKLQAERTSLANQLRENVRKGYIQEGSDVWKKWQNELAELDNQIIDTQNEISETAIKQISHIQEKWQTLLDYYDTVVANKQAQLSSQTFKADNKTLALNKQIVSRYNTEVESMQNQAREMQAQLDTAVRKGYIKQYSEEWYKQYTAIQKIYTDIINKQNDISQVAVDNLNYIQNRSQIHLTNLSTALTKLQNITSYRSAQGYDATRGNYEAQIAKLEIQKQTLVKESSNLQNQLDKAVASGQIEQYSEEWYKWYNQIRQVNNEIISTSTQIEQLNNSIRQLEWTKFERAQGIISDTADELSFIQDLFYDNDLFDKDTGRITAQGRASEGIIAQRYDLYMKQAQEYGKVVQKLNAQIANDPNNQTLINQRNSYLKAQQDSISAAHKEKEAMADLVEKGINLQIDAMNKLIEKYTEALDAQREEQNYAESIAEKQKKINSLQKQLRSMNGDDSEEGKARRQQLQDQLKEAQKDLKDAQEDHRIDAIKDVLSDMQEKYSDTLNARLDNIDGLFNDTISAINKNGSNIADTIATEVRSVGYSLSEALSATYQNVKNTNGNNNSSLVSNTNANGNFTNSNATTIKTAKSGSSKVSTNPTTAQTTGWVNSNKQYIDPSTGGLKKGLASIGGKTYYFDDGGTIVTGLQTINGKKYYFDSNGAAKTGTFRVGNTTYTADSNGVITRTVVTTTTRRATTTTRRTTTTTTTRRTTTTTTTRRATTTTRRTTTTTTTRRTTTTTTTRRTTTTTTTRRATTTTKKKTTTKKITNSNNSNNTVTKKETSTTTKKATTTTKKVTATTKKATTTTKKTTTTTKKITNSKNSNNTITPATTKKSTTTKKTTTTTTKKKGKLASGTAHVKRSGIYQVDEKGQEIFINSNGKIYTRLEKGATVLPHDAAVNLLKGMQNPVDFIMSHMDMRPNKNITTTNNTSGDTTNNITFNIPNVTNYAEFMREAQRDPNFTKYIQEISLGKLNGNNSLKGNSIRFR